MAHGQNEGKYDGILDIRPVTGHCGVEILGLDLSKPLPEEAYAAIRRATADYGVAFFRGQSLTPTDHDRFARHFGPVKKVRFVKTVEGYPHMSEVRKEEQQTTNIGGAWHTDGSFYAEPPTGSILVARELPPVGGDTLFLNMAAVYESLSEGLKATLSRLRAVHSNSGYRFAKSGGGLINTDQDEEKAVHPVVVTHPVNGRKSLYVNAAYTKHFEGWSEAESQPLLQYLYSYARERAEFFCRFHWDEGSVAFWDNITAWHYAANDYQGERRLMHRITFEGEPLA
ncbi:MAG TPA: TauD/TfdA family dioxygenase [Sphingomonadaceae bacterium]|nr:TauD/TfdA family dioxygenase [Sphingomonadaceae bacterium]